MSQKLSREIRKTPGVDFLALRTQVYVLTGKSVSYGLLYTTLTDEHDMGTPIKAY